MIDWVRVGTCLSVCCVTASALFMMGPSTAPAPASQPAQIKPAFAAMEYFDINCARCHGPQGSFYGREFGKHLNDATLIKFVRDMAEGPGNAPLQADDLKVEVAYHRALVRGEPFVSITANQNGTMRGEVSPGSTVTVDGNPAQVEGFTWSAPAGSEIIAAREKKKTVLRATDGYSHQQPIGEK